MEILKGRKGGTLKVAHKLPFRYSIELLFTKHCATILAVDDIFKCIRQFTIYLPPYDRIQKALDRLPTSSKNLLSVPLVSTKLGRRSLSCGSPNLLNTRKEKHFQLS